MKEKQIKLPGPGNPISVECGPARLVVSLEGLKVADIYATNVTLPMG
jgi:hypothetical protein